MPSGTSEIGQLATDSDDGRIELIGIDHSVLVAQHPGDAAFATFYRIIRHLERELKIPNHSVPK